MSDEKKKVMDEDTTSSAAKDMKRDLLDDIYMDLSVEVGRTKMKISDLLNLTTGSLVELNQSASDPLNIYANDKLIAKGHIVSSNGKYSIKVL